jgi:arabinogalactan oligomer/maltooligosaccharide transport system permease protein
VSQKVEFIQGGTGTSVPAMAARARRPRMRTDERVQLWASRVLVWLIIAIVFFPVWGVLAVALSATGGTGGELIPQNPTLDNFRDVLTCPGAASCVPPATQLPGEGFPGWLRTTMIVGAIVATIQVFMTAFAAYAFSRLHFWGRRWGIAVLFLIQSFPAFMATPAIFMSLVYVGLNDTIVALIVIHLTASAFWIWMLKGFLDGLPRELDEAASVDGANSWQTFRFVILPLALPMLAVLFLFNFMSPFNEFFLTSLVNKNPELYTVPVGMYIFVRDNFTSRYGFYAAATLLTAIPLALVWGFGQRFVQAGLTRGAVKG